MSDALLDLQRLDTTSEQLVHRRANLAQRQALSDAVSEQERQQREIDVVAAARAEVATRQRRLEVEAQSISAKADTDDARLYSGEVTAIKDLEALQHEIAGLRARQGEFEDQALEAMMEAEELANQVTELEAGRATIDQVIAGLEAEIAEAEVEIDAELERVGGERRELATAIDSALVAEYERRRPAFGAATVVRFDGSGCSGCPSAMPAVEVDRIKHLDGSDPADCEECGRVVLR